jgi:hypothetical protein
MAAIGKCKQSSLRDYTGPNPYLTSEARTEAFWLTFFACLTIDDSGTDVKDQMQFYKWLPDIPTSWSPSTPPVTVVNTGCLESAELGAAEHRNLHKLQELVTDGELRIEMTGIAMLTNLKPEEWTDEDRAYYTARFEELAKRWQDQPFDLYHRPFSLPTVVPGSFLRCAAAGG